MCTLHPECDSIWQTKIYLFKIAKAQWGLLKFKAWSPKAKITVKNGCQTHTRNYNQSVIIKITQPNSKWSPKNKNLLLLEKSQFMSSLLLQTTFFRKLHRRGYGSNKFDFLYRAYMYIDILGEYCDIAEKSADKSMFDHCHLVHLQMAALW